MDFFEKISYLKKPFMMNFRVNIIMNIVKLPNIGEFEECEREALLYLKIPIHQILRYGKNIQQVFMFGTVEDQNINIEQRGLGGGGGGGGDGA